MSDGERVSIYDVPERGDDEPIPRDGLCVGCGKPLGWRRETCFDCGARRATDEGP